LNWDIHWIELKPLDRIETSRLKLVASTLDLLDAELESNQRLASMLNAHVPEGWPPGEYDRPAIQYFRDRLAENPEAVGWYGWYALFQSDDDGMWSVVGAGGFFGPPDREGVLEIGYSVVSAYAGRGLATEMVGALVRHAFSDIRVKRIKAHTTPGNVGSVKVLERTGFAYVGQGHDPGTVEYGRGAPAT
jgi:[ribosomal protein S5]-alanine N-acetyltransferase